MTLTEMEKIKRIQEDFERETGRPVSRDEADVLLDRALFAHSERLASTGYCPGGYCCDGTGEPAVVEAPPPEPELPPCAWCGEPCGNPQGMCYECQCEAHAAGAFNMDGQR